MPAKKVKVQPVRQAQGERSKLKVEKKTEPVRSVEAKKVKNALSLDVFDVKGKVVGSIVLPEEIFGLKINKALIAQAVRVFLANQRSGTSSTKTRGEVQGSSRKIYKQKGTGRARHGSVRAPIFVHGGIVFGPRPRDHSLDMPKKMKRKALFAALSAKVKKGEVKVVDGIEKIKPKTKEMASVLRNLSLNTKEQSVLFVVPQEKQDNVFRAARNIDGLTYRYAQQIHTYEILQNRTVLFTKGALENLKSVFGGEK